MVCGPKAQRARSSPSQGRSALEWIPPKNFMRPEGPVVPFDESKDQGNVRPFRQRCEAFLKSKIGNSMSGAATATPMFSTVRST